MRVNPAKLRVKGTGGERFLGKTLELFLPEGWPDREGAVQWRLRAGLRSTHGQADDLKRLPADTKAPHVIVWTPPADTLLTRANLPTRSWRKIQQALPYALEEQLLGDPAEQHFACHREADGSLAVAVTARARIKAWLETLRAAGVQPARLCPAILALPLERGTWSVAFIEDRLWVRTGALSGFACSASAQTVPALLKAATGEAREHERAPHGLTVFNPPSDFNADHWRTVLGIDVTVSGRPFWENGHSTVAPLNLLQGDFAPAGKFRETLKPLTVAASLLAVWLVGSLGFNLWEWWELTGQRQTYQAAMTELFKRTFPETKVVLDPSRQMERNLENLRGKRGRAGSSDLLALLTSVAPALKANPDISLRTLKYAEAKLTIDLTLPDFEALENVKNALRTTRGIDVEVLAANSRSSGVAGRLRIQARDDTEGGG
ncbi:MAG: type II secretion system protein GspL [Acidiferrobacterales bacterium]